LAWLVLWYQDQYQLGFQPSTRPTLVLTHTHQCYAYIWLGVKPPQVGTDLKSGLLPIEDVLVFTLSCMQGRELPSKLHILLVKQACDNLSALWFTNVQNGWST
jgi:hypothetical protein